MVFRRYQPGNLWPRGVYGKKTRSLKEILKFLVDSFVNHFWQYFSNNLHAMNTYRDFVLSVTFGMVYLKNYWKTLRVNFWKNKRKYQKLKKSCFLIPREIPFGISTKDLSELSPADFAKFLIYFFISTGVLSDIFFASLKEVQFKILQKVIQSYPQKSLQKLVFFFLREFSLPGIPL